MISFLGHPGSILVDDQHWGNAGIETAIFADGTVWNHAELMAHYVCGQQSAGSDTIHGSSLADVVEAGDGDDVAVTGYGSDTLIGGLGNDRLEGGEGADTYVYHAGDGAADFQIALGNGPAPVAADFIL